MTDTIDPILAERLRLQRQQAQQVQIRPRPGADVNYVTAREERFQRLMAALKAQVWEAGSDEAKQLNLPPLLEKKRQEHLIPNAIFNSFPLYDRVFIYQLAEKDTLEAWETFGDTSIVKPDRVADRDKEANPRGIIVAAGLLALDQLSSNGVELGHTVRFQRFTPYCHVVDNIEGVKIYVQSMLAGHIVSSEDLEQERRAGLKAYTKDLTTGQHEWVDTTGLSEKPRRPVRGVDE